MLNTLNIEMNTAFGAINRAYDVYVVNCKWGILNIEGLLLATKNWILDNDN